MARRRRVDDEGVSLFPFMSILACLIGILTLMISVSMTAKQQQVGMNKEDFLRAKENERLTRELQTMAQEVEALRKQAKINNALLVNLQQLEQQKANLSSTLQLLQKTGDGETDAVLKKRIEMMRTETASIRREQPELEQKIIELRAELAKRKSRPQPRESVTIRPGGSLNAKGRTLFFVECNSSGISIREKGKEPVVLSTAAIKDSIEFAEFCEKAGGETNGQVVFLMRRAGFNAYNWAAGIAVDTYGLSVGKLPIPNDGEIDLSLFWNP